MMTPYDKSPPTFGDFDDENETPAMGFRAILSGIAVSMVCMAFVYGLLAL